MRSSFLKIMQRINGEEINRVWRTHILNKITETWECTECAGSEYPCKIEINFPKDPKWPDLDKADHFVRKSCLCNSCPFPNWKRINQPDNDTCPLIGVKCDRAEEQVGDHLCPDCKERE